MYDFLSLVAPVFRHILIVLACINKVLLAAMLLLLLLLLIGK
jgi:hypothetical protein